MISHLMLPHKLSLISFERSFVSLSEAEEENGQSRIYLGIHWSLDKSEGIKQGNRVADYVFDHVFKPKHGRGN